MSPMPAKQPSAPRALSILSYAILLAGIITIGLSIYMAVVSYLSLPLLGRMDPD